MIQINLTPKEYKAVLKALRKSKDKGSKDVLNRISL